MHHSFASLERPHPRKGHDRLVVAGNGEIDSFAVFDGAGDAKGSERAARIFKRQSSARMPVDLEETFKTMHGAVARQRHLAKGKVILRHIWHHEELGLTRREALHEAQTWPVGLTTCAAVRLDSTNSHTVMQYSVAGDSSIRLLNHISGDSEVITDKVNPLPDNKTDASGFIGSKKYQKPGKYGKLALPDVATIGIFTDGIDYWRDGCGYDIDEVLASDEQPDIKASTIAGGTRGLDDLAVIIIEHQLV